MTYNDPFNSTTNSTSPQPQTMYQQATNTTQGQYQQYAGANPVINAQPVSMESRAVRTSVATAYGEMAVGLLITAVVAWFSASSFSNYLTYRVLASVGNFGWYAIMIAQVVLAMFIGMKAMTMKPSTARILFYVYAATMGFTLSTIFFVYNVGSIGIALGLTAGFFLCLTMIGLTTKRNLLKAGPILLTALIVLIVVELILMLTGVSGVTMILAGITLIIFAGLTAYDAQKTRLLYQQYGTNPEMIQRISIVAALNLYLDFINIFLSVLQLFGSRD